MVSGDASAIPSAIPSASTAERRPDAGERVGGKHRTRLIKYNLFLKEPALDLARGLSLAQDLQGWQVRASGLRGQVRSATTEGTLNAWMECASRMRRWVR